MPVDAVTSLDSSSAGWQRYAIHQVPRTLQALRRQAELPTRILSQVPEFIAGVLEELPSLADAEPQGQDLVLVSGDITEDHVLLIQKEDRWQISGLIDFADARIAPAHYEWVALWFGALDREPDALDAFFRGYDPAAHLDAAFYRRALAFTFLHEFGALIIAQTLSRRAQRQVGDVNDLMAALWQPQ
jgi:Ser/Thr protein kinase RdoA (MazF antagonist)